MPDQSTNLDTLVASQAGKEITANALFDAVGWAALGGRRSSTTSGLTWGYYGGTVNVGGTPTSVANGTLTLTASATNYIELDPATGAVSKNTSGFTAGRCPLYIVTAGASTVSNYTDERAVALATA